MISILLALALSQTVPTEAELNGAYNAAQIAAAEAVAGTRTISPVSAARSCIRFAGGGGAPSGAVTISFGSVLLTPAFQQAVSLDLPPDVPDWAAARDEYSYVEVQAVPTATRDPQSVPVHMDLLPEERFKETGPTMPICEVLLIRRDHVGVPFRCACSTGSNCTVGGSAAPTHQTLRPGTWTGAGCHVKPCFGRFEGGPDFTWPSDCP